MDAEQIVRALAAADPIGPDKPWCDLCRGNKDGHDPDCPWRLAVEWVAAEDCRALEADGLLGRLADDLAAHAVSLGTVTSDYASIGTGESDAVAALLAEARAALGRDVG